MRRADWIDRLTLSAAIGTSGAVDALNSDYVVTYSSNIDNEYVYNYYLVGASVGLMPNPDLKWRTLVSRSVALQAEFAHAFRLRVEYYNNDSKDLMTVDRLPLASGYRHNVSNGGRVRNSGLEYYLNATLYSRPGLVVSAFTSGNHNRNRIEELPGFFAAWYNEALSEGEAPLSEGESVNAIYAAESSFDGTAERAAGESVAAGRAEPDLKGNFGVNVAWDGGISELRSITGSADRHSTRRCTMCSSAVRSIISTDGRWTRSSAARSTANRSGCNGSWNGSTP